MALETLQPSADPVLSSKEAPPRVKFRIRFRKADDLRFVSHHDLMHIFERVFRRANLSVPTSQGFNPRPRMWFALSLALGIAGLKEVLELELSEPLNAEELQQRLTAHAPPGIVILSVRMIDVKTSARVLRSWYRVAEDASQSGAPARERCAAFMNESACWIERSRPQRRRINLRPFVSELHVRDGGIEMALWITPQGAARPEEIITALGLASLLEEGAVMERIDLEIIDELPPGAPTMAPVLANAMEQTRSDDKDSPQEAAASARPTAIIEDPMSFDS